MPGGLLAGASIGDPMLYIPKSRHYQESLSPNGCRRERIPRAFPLPSAAFPSKIPYSLMFYSLCRAALQPKRCRTQTGDSNSLYGEEDHGLTPLVWFELRRMKGAEDTEHLSPALLSGSQRPNSVCTSCRGIQGLCSAGWMELEPERVDLVSFGWI